MIKESNLFKQISKASLPTTKLKVPRVKNNAFLISGLVFVFNKVFEYSKKSFKKFSINKSLFICNNLGTNLIKQIKTLGYFILFLHFIKFSTNLVYNAGSLKKEGSE